MNQQRQSVATVICDTNSIDFRTTYPRVEIRSVTIYSGDILGRRRWRGFPAFVFQEDQQEYKDGTTFVPEKKTWSSRSISTRRWEITHRSTSSSRQRLVGYDTAALDFKLRHFDHRADETSIFGFRQREILTYLRKNADGERKTARYYQPLSQDSTSSKPTTTTTSDDNTTLLLLLLIHGLLIN